MSWEQVGLNVAAILAGLAAAVEAFRSRRKADRAATAGETIRQAVTPDGDTDALSRRLDGIETSVRDVVREQREQRRALDHVVHDVATHIQLHTFIGGVRPRWPVDAWPDDPAGDRRRPVRGPGRPGRPEGSQEPDRGPQSGARAREQGDGGDQQE